MPTDISLEEAINAAATAEPAVRIELRDSIARHGDLAIERVEPWLADPGLAAFAIRVLVRAAEFGSEARARQALQRGMPGLREPVLSDAKAALIKLGGRPRTAPVKGDRRIDTHIAAALDELEIGKIYSRRALHVAGLGGNWQKGISYPATGTYVLLFSDPNAVDDWGYRDGPSGPAGYIYYGEWSGTGDMLPTGGNAAIVDRSPEIYLFVKTPPGHRFLGRFACLGSSHRRATREGREHTAIVFTLEREVADGQR